MCMGWVLSSVTMSEGLLCTSCEAVPPLRGTHRPGECSPQQLWCRGQEPQVRGLPEQGLGNMALVCCSLTVAELVLKLT